MAGDGRFGDEGAENADDDAVRNRAGGEPLDGGGEYGGGDEYDAALGEPAAAPVGPAGADSDPVANELSALFAAALADEPPSRVTAESVLREVRAGNRVGRGGFAGWLASGPLSLKWAGGLVAAAALIAAVIVTVPNVGSSTDSTTAAGSQIYSSAAAGGESDKVAAEQSVAAADSAGGADSGDSAASAEMAPQAAPMSGRSEMSSSSESAEAAPGSEAYSLESAPAGGAAADGGAGAAGDQGQRSAGSGGAESSSASPTGSETAAASSSGNDCSLPSLAPAEWSAAVAALPADVTTTRLPGSGCQAGALRGNGIEVLRGGEQAGSLLWIVVSDGPIGRDGAATNSTVVSATHGQVTVTMIANQSGDPWLDEAALQRLVDAVAAAS